MSTKAQRKTWRRESDRRSRVMSENSPTVNILDARVLLLLDEIEALEKKLG